jgi:hypothetical protein
VVPAGEVNVMAGKLPVTGPVIAPVTPFAFTRFQVKVELVIEDVTDANVVVPPEQTIWLAEPDITGSGLMVMVDIAVFEQPFASVPVTV